MKIEHLCNFRIHIFQKVAVVSLYEAFTCTCKSGLQKKYLQRV
jgi:hypothetical protein